MDAMRTVMSADGEIAGELIFIIQADQALPCLRVKDGFAERLLLIPWSKLRLAPELFVLDMTKDELLEAGFPEIPSNHFPSREELRARQPTNLLKSGSISLN